MYQSNLKDCGNVLKKEVKPADRGWGTADTGGSGLTTVVAVVLVASGLFGLWRMFDSGSESANLQEIATKTKGYMGGAQRVRFYECHDYDRQFYPARPCT